MNPALLALILEAAIKYGPDFVAAIVDMCHSEEPSLAKWQAAFAKAEKPFEDK